MLGTEDYLKAILKQGFALDGGCKTITVGLQVYCPAVVLQCTNKVWLLLSARAVITSQDWRSFLRINPNVSPSSKGDGQCSPYHCSMRDLNRPFVISDQYNYKCCRVILEKWNSGLEKQNRRVQNYFCICYM